MSSLRLGAIMTAIALGSNSNFGGYHSPFSRRELREPKEPTEEQLQAEERTISEAEEKRKRKAEKRLKQFNKADSIYG